MTPTAVLTALRYALSSGFADYRAIYTWRTWLAGWLSRVLCQVAFFGLIGRLLGSPDATKFLLVGNAAMIVAVEACFVCASTAWERKAGTLPLLLAAPASPMITFAARSLFWLGSGVVTAGVSIFALPPLFGVALPWPRAVLAVPVIAAIGLATYCFALVLAGLVLSVMELRNVASNLAQLTLMALCGVQVPTSFWPGWLEAAASVLPLRHGLAGLRGLLDGAPLSGVVRAVGLELAVGLGWFVVATLTFRRLAEAGRRDGSVEFG